ncbi:S-adenosyl-L-methionine-dependent methyltransferase [Pelagophyceae sp. CCMP2097]|nr:S-adenosyl-L-methionine-dependent methyltransferase [Pelagophyceae sp. CCMP2097]
MLRSMAQKAKPFAYVDTHAGAGLYGLDAAESLVLREFDNGIGMLREMDDFSTAPPIIEDFVNLQTQTSTSLDRQVYLGSAAVARCMLRAGDHALCFERSNEVHGVLSEHMDQLTAALGGAEDPRCLVRCEDGWAGLRLASQALSAQRGLVFVDPPYQDGSDTDQSVKMLKHLRKTWRSARVALWYPLSEYSSANRDRLHAAAKELDCDVLVAEFSIASPSEQRRLPGSGFLFVQPPFQLQEELNDLLPKLGDLLKCRDDDAVQANVFALKTGKNG